MDDLYKKCMEYAKYLVDNKLSVGDICVDQLADTMWKLEKEKEEKNAITDQQLNYNDEIISIEEIEEELETIDISVSGDNLFYCNGILTKNSFGLPATADFMFAMISNDDYEERKQIHFKQLKNRFNDTNYYKRFLVGVDRSKMQLFDLDNETVEVKELTEFDKPATQDKSFNSSKYKDLLT